MVEFFRRHANGSSAPASGGDVDPVLDVAFYKGLYSDLAPLSDAAAATHWRLHGRRENRIPSTTAAILRHPKFDQLPADFDPAGYVYTNKDLTREYFNVYAATMHFLQFGLGEARSHKALVVDEDFVAVLRSTPDEPTAFANADPRLKWLPSTPDQYLYFSGFSSSDFLNDLDPDFYFYTSGIEKNVANRGIYGCVLHFADRGVDDLAPINQHLIFDPHFYRGLVRPSFGQGLAQTSDVELYKQWLSRRDFRNFPPNHRQKMKQSFGVANAGLELLDPDAYRVANADLRNLDNEALLEQLFEYGLLEQRSSIKIDRSNVMVFTRYADHLQLQGRLADAERIYFRLVHLVPDHAGLNQRLGDFLVRRERYAEAFGCYKRNMDSGQASKWAYLNAASCCERLADLRTALSTMNAGCRAYPDDQAFIRQRQSYAERYFADEFHYARALASTGKIAQAQALEFAAAEACNFTPVGEAAPRRISTIALFANMDLAQCTLYRVEQKAEQLIEAGFVVKVFNWSSDQAAFERSMASFDMVIFYRVASFPGILRLINGARAAGLVTAYEIDDLIFDEHEFPEPFANYAGQITTAEYVDVCMGVPLFRHALGLCDYAIASTPPLAERIEPYVRRKRAFVHRNALGLRHERACEVVRAARSERAPVTIFYGSGTKAHKGDFETILLPALEEIDRRYGGSVRFVFAGHKPVTAKDEFFSRVHFVPFTPEVEDYWAALGQADINLSVLRRTPATDAKSEIKWLEAAMFGIPSVVSTTDTFVGVIEDGVDGFLAVTTDDFIDKIALLVRDKARRNAIGAAAKAKALRDYGRDALKTNIQEIVAAVQPRPAIVTPVRVLVVNVFYPPQTKGGATRVVIDNIADIRDLYSKEFEFEVFTTLEGGQQPYDVHVSSYDGIRTTAMTAGNDPDVDSAALDERAGEVFRRCVERFDPHLIHFHCIQRISAAATEVALLKQIPYVITAHDGWWISDRQFLFDKAAPAACYDFNQLMRHRIGIEHGAYDRPLKLLPSLQGAEAILTVSEPFADVYRSTGLTNVRAVPNGMPRVSAIPAAEHPARRPSAKVRIAHIGGTSEHKGYHLFRYAVFAAKPSNLSVTVVELGLEPGEEQYEDWNGTPVRIIAKRPQSEVNALYGEIDVLFAPSLWPESFGLVTREALAAGCWVVASDRGAVAEPVIENVNGHVVSVDTLDDLVRTVKRIDADPGRYKAMPPAMTPQRRSQDQAKDLADMYRRLARKSGRHVARP